MSLQHRIRTQWQRSKKVASVTHAFIGGFKKAHQIGAFKEPPRDILPNYIQVFCRKMCLAFGVQVVTVKPMPATHGLWASNHISWLDIPVAGSVSGAFFLSKAEIAKWPLVGALAKAGGTLFIQRGSGDAGTVAEQIAKFMTQGASVLFFPEATTTNGHKIKRIHGKLLQAAIQTNLPIQPMVICYVDKHGHISTQIPYYGDMTIKDSFMHVLDDDEITAYVLPLEPLYPDGKSQHELTDLLQQRLQDGLSTLQQQVLTVKPTDALW